MRDDGVPTPSLSPPLLASLRLAQDMLGGRKSPKISSRKGFGREPQPNGAKHALSPSAKLRINSVKGFAKSGLAGEYSEDCRLMNQRR